MTSWGLPQISCLSFHRQRWQKQPKFERIYAVSTIGAGLAKTFSDIQADRAGSCSRFLSDSCWGSCGKVRNDHSGIAGSAVSFSFPELPDGEFRNRSRCDLFLNSGMVKTGNSLTLWFLEQ